jgi:hypothetical protein
MTVSKIPYSARAERLKIALRLYNALVAQDPDRVIALYVGARMVARHDLRLEQSDPEVTS